MSSWFNISEDIWVVWRLCRLCRQRLAILGCWVFAFLAWFPIPGTRTSAPEGRRWLPTELVFQNIPQPDTVVPWEAADPLSTATTQKTVEERILRGGARRTCCEHFSGLKGMPWSRLHFFFLAGTERFPFFLWTEPRLEIRKSPVRVPQESRKGYCFPFHMRPLPCPGMALRNTQMFAPPKAAKCLLNK